MQQTTCALEFACLILCFFVDVDDYGLVTSRLFKYSWVLYKLEAEHERYHRFFKIKFTTALPTSPEDSSTRHQWNSYLD